MFPEFCLISKTSMNSFKSLTLVDDSMVNPWQSTATQYFAGYFRIFHSQQMIPEIDLAFTRDRIPGLF